MRGRNGIMIVGIIISLTMLFCQPALGDVAAEPAGGVASEGAHQTYLKNVYVFLDVEDTNGTGVGYFTIHNPSDVPEEFTICFDPGHERTGAYVTVDGKSVDTYEDRITTLRNETYHGICFDNTFGPSSTSNITIRWGFSILEYKIRSDNNITVNHLAKYKIIGYAGWNHSIETVDVTFRINSDHFNDLRVWAFGLDETRYVKYGATFIKFHCSDFWIDELKIVIIGDQDVVDGSILFAVPEGLNEPRYGLLLGIIVFGWLVLFSYLNLKTPKD